MVFWYSYKDCSVRPVESAKVHNMYNLCTGNIVTMNLDVFSSTADKGLAFPLETPYWPKVNSGISMVLTAQVLPPSLVDISPVTPWPLPLVLM